MHAPATKHELEVRQAELAAAERRRAQDPIYKAQTTAR
jgi:hypothetical protein